MAGDQRCCKGARLELSETHTHKIEDVGYVPSLRVLHGRASGVYRVIGVARNAM